MPSATITVTVKDALGAKATVTAVATQSAVTLLPVVTPATFTVPTPVTADQLIGHLTVTESNS